MPFLRRTATSVVRAHVAPTHQPEWEPAGGWDNTTAIHSVGSNKVYVYADGTQKQVQANGKIAIIFGGTEWKQYAESAAQTALFYRDGRKTVWFPTGHILDTLSDGSKMQTNPHGSTIEDLANGSRMCTNADGSTIQTLPDDALQKIDFPLGPAYGCKQEILTWPKIKSIHIKSIGCDSNARHTTRYMGVDGTKIQPDPPGAEGTMLVRWAPGNCTEADEHYGDRKWSMTVAANGETRYLHRIGTETNVEGAGYTQQIWCEDPYWKIQIGIREKAERDAAASKDEHDIPLCEIMDMLTPESQNDMHRIVDKLI